jgi:hypothetical protein
MGPWVVTAGPSSTSADLTIVVTITDGCSLRTATATITVSQGCIITLSPTKSAADNEKIAIGATGGTPPYVFEISAPADPCGAIDPLSGDYLAPSTSACTGTDTIKATDTTGCTGTVDVNISADAVDVTTSGSGTATVTITGPTGATLTKEAGDGTLSATGNSGTYTVASGENDVAVVKVTATSGEWAKVIIRVANGTCTVEEPIAVTDVNMSGTTTTSDLTPVIDKILGL